ncbi:hypothetical protein GCM10010964_43300 [Caldovatus sediminis]|uniref:Uncharacterized protein n=1 Tax=Caldovatus sediminis TaxID=2041189 RepID=A0A8J2ZFT4_9PROT|nr:hypothetical protein [Caldovatus sediminis]GGG51400.1 hypothetical protein GCM10010964_43300 [Caldovatus sediminis]
MAEWDGRPQNPERMGWHWLRSVAGDLALCPMWWDAYRRAWRLSTGRLLWSSALLGDSWRYVGPCLPPDEMTAALAAARREGAEEMRTRAAALCLRRAHASAEDDLTPIEEAVRDEAIYCARAIRALEIEG